MWIPWFAVIWTVVAFSAADNSCPEVKILGIGDTDKLTILRGCPGFPGSPGQKGEVGSPGAKGDNGLQGIAGKLGPSRCEGLLTAPKAKRGKKVTLDPLSPCMEESDRMMGVVVALSVTVNHDGFPHTGTPSGHVVKGGHTLALGLLADAAKNCKELLERGEVLSDWYTIYPESQKPLKVLCDMHTDGGGWIVFQRRWDGSVDFFRDWNSYKNGFGSRLNEFWLGNDNLYMLTSSGTWEMRIDLQDFENTKHYAKYASFQVLGEDKSYKLLLGDFKEGNAGNAMDVHADQPFSTKDKDLTAEKCATLYKGGWWYYKCHHSNLNGLYLGGQHASYANGINWAYGKGFNYSYKFSEMKIRPVQ